MVKGCAFSERNWCCVRTAFSADGQYFAVRWEKTCRVYTIATQELYTEYDAGTWVYSIDFSPCGKYLAIGTANNVKIVEFAQTPTGEGHNLECCT